jgi:hypothetical protein
MYTDEQIEEAIARGNKDELKGIREELMNWLKTWEEVPGEEAEVKKGILKRQLASIYVCAANQYFKA